MTTRTHAENLEFIRTHTRPIPVSGLEPLVLWQADDVTPIWEATEADLRKNRLDPPFWAFAWAGGVGLARFIIDRPQLVMNKRVLDLACGSGIVGLSAALAGAEKVVWNDIDPMCEAAVELNSELNLRPCQRRQAEWRSGDLLGVELEDFDVVLAGDVFYEKQMADRFISYLKKARGRGADVFAGDPGRAYAPRDLTVSARYCVPTSLSIENETEKTTAILAF